MKSTSRENKSTTPLTKTTAMQYLIGALTRYISTCEDEEQRLRLINVLESLMIDYVSTERRQMKSIKRLKR